MNYNDSPPLDLSILHSQLRSLYLKGQMAAMEHNTYLSQKGVPWTFTSSWYQDIIEEDSYYSMSAAEDSISWTALDQDGDSVYMQVPISVLDDRETPLEWAVRTYTRYQEHERVRAAEASKKWDARKENRRAEYEKLKMEFEDANGTEVS